MLIMIVTNPKNTSLTADLFSTDYKIMHFFFSFLLASLSRISRVGWSLICRTTSWNTLITLMLHRADVSMYTPPARCASCSPSAEGRMRSFVRSHLSDVSDERSEARKYGLGTARRGRAVGGRRGVGGRGKVPLTANNDHWNQVFLLQAEDLVARSDDVVEAFLAQ